MQKANNNFVKRNIYMTIDQIHPHVRFAMTFKYPLKKSPLIAYDSHIYYIIKGSGSITAGGKKEQFREDCVINIPAGIDYFFESDGDVVCTSINYDYTKSNSSEENAIFPVTVSEFKSEKISELACFEDYLMLNGVEVFSYAESVKEKFKKIEEEFVSQKRFFRETASFTLGEILIELLHMNISGAETDKKINKVLLYIQDHFAEDISNTKLSEVFGYHPYHLNRLMKASLGTTLHRYLIFYRIEKAKRFLTDTPSTVFEVSRMCGYNNFSNFSHDFKKRTGYTPIGYRERGKKR